MRNPLRSFGLRCTRSGALWTAVLAPPVILATYGSDYRWWAIAAVAVALLVSVLTIGGRRITGWSAVWLAWLRRRRRPLGTPSAAVVGSTLSPGDEVAVRWEGATLVALIELRPRPFTPTVVVDGRARTDDTLDSQLLERLLAVSCPDLEADIVSAGYRFGQAAPEEIADLYRGTAGADPAPAHRRSWILLRANPHRSYRSARRRQAGAPGLIRYLVASATRVADQLAGSGVDAVCAAGFADFDQATAVDLDREGWSSLKGHAGFTTAYAAPGGPDVWWSIEADHTLTRLRVSPGRRPRSAVVLTTPSKPVNPQGFSRFRGAQRAAVAGDMLGADEHHRIPIGSAGVLVGRTMQGDPMYLPFDDVDSGVDADPDIFAEFAVCAAGAGAAVTLDEEFAELAEHLGGTVGPRPKLAWPQATTFLGAGPGLASVVIAPDRITTDRQRLAITPITPPDPTDQHVEPAPAPVEPPRRGRHALAASH